MSIRLSSPALIASTVGRYGTYVFYLPSRLFADDELTRWWHKRFDEFGRRLGATAIVMTPYDDIIQRFREDLAELAGMPAKVADLVRGSKPILLIADRPYGVAHEFPNAVVFDLSVRREHLGELLDTIVNLVRDDKQVVGGLHTWMNSVDREQAGRDLASGVEIQPGLFGVSVNVTGVSAALRWLLTAARARRPR